MSKPNVIFVLTDDQGYGDLSCHGNPVIKTPYLDALREESVRFTDFHVSPMCTPTRGELMTGQDALRNGATFVCMGRSLINPELPTIADILSNNGYRTGHFGKWHLGDNYPYRPQDRGFQETIHHPAWGITSAADYFGNDYFDDTYRHNGEYEAFEGYCTDVWFDEAMKWIERSDEGPFFAYVATNAPHTPLWVPDKYRQPYLEQVDYPVASFFGMIVNIDENMARLDAFLKEKGLYDNTILIYMTDNGTANGEPVYNAGMRGKKTMLYEGGHRVPFFIRWPEGGLGVPRDISDMTHGTDFAPTLVSLCGLETPEGTAFDGVSLAGLLRGECDHLEDRMKVVQYGQTENKERRFTGKGNAAVLWHRWRLVDYEELYNLDDDPGQKNNIADQHLNVVEKMQAHYDGWWNELGENFERYYPISIGTDIENPARLSSCDWLRVYCDNPNGVRGCVMDSGIWQLAVSQDGTYEITLRRWPEESGLAITAPAPVMEGVDGTLQAGKALLAVRAWMQIGKSVQETEVQVGDAAVTMTVDLEEGPTHLQTWWIDEKGERLAGAYYVTIERVS
ncbi:MAG: arylsulfatase [Gemmatimonadetes bacterium]|nr:arylsulfatase [Gemmatimonadota bacterium]